MSVRRGPPTAYISVATQMEAIPVLVIQDTHWILMDTHVT